MTRKKLLVGADGSSHEEEVVDGAVAIAKGIDAELHLFRAIRIEPSAPHGALSLTPAELEAETIRGAERDLEMLMLRVPARFRGEVRVVIGVPVAAIDEAARALDVDAVVIGARGHGLLDRILGSTAAKIVNHADRTVVVVRSAHRLQR